jgi:hypothetical protein
MGSLKSMATELMCQKLHSYLKDTEAATKSLIRNFAEDKKRLHDLAHDTTSGRLTAAAVRILYGGTSSLKNGAS